MATVGSSVQSGIQEEDHHFMRVLKALTCEGRLTLLQVLKWGCPKTELETYEKYLIDSGLSRKLYKNTFAKQQREKISRNPSGDEFDITLLYKMIQRACHSLASPGDDMWTITNSTCLEYWLTCIKNSRNNLMHDLSIFTQATMVDKIENIREILTKVMEMSGTLYSVNIGTVDQMIRRINDNLNNIRDQPFAPLDPRSNQSLFETLKDLLRFSGAQELKQKYDSKIFFNPLSFLDKNECHLKVSSVFVRPAIEENKDMTSCRAVHFKDLLEHLDITTPDSLMILEGQPGAGKTTLLRLYMSEWIADGGDIKGLSDYEIVLHFECRDTSIDSFTQLLLSHMPKTTSKFQKNDLKLILLSLKVMVLVDGLDELNEASQKVLKEILNIKNSRDFTLICTTRPERIPEVKKLVSGRMKVVNMIIQGIPIQEREKFVRAYHCQRKQHGIQQQDIDSLLEYLRQVPPHLEDFLRFPLNLVMLTILWDDANSRVREITSTTALYLETHNLLIEKLLERLMNHPSTQHMSLTQLTTKCDTFLAYMYWEALRAQTDDAVFLNRSQIKVLNQLCDSLYLPAEEIFSAFLVSASNDRFITLSKEVKFPHKTLQDFYTAKHVTFLLEEDLVHDLSIFKKKFDESDEPSKQQIVKRTRKLLGQPISVRSVLLQFHKDPSESQYFEKYTNILFQLVYLLHNSDPKTLEHYAEEVVTLLDAGKHIQFQHWVDLLKESQYNPTLAQNISTVLSTSDWRVMDQQVKAAVAFLSYNCPSRLNIIIENDPEHVPHLYDLMEAAAATHNCEITYYFNHHLYYPESGLSNSLLQKLVFSKEKDSRPVSLSSTNSQDDLPSHCKRLLFFNFH